MDVGESEVVGGIAGTYSSSPPIRCPGLTANTSDTLAPKRTPIYMGLGDELQRRIAHSAHKCIAVLVVGGSKEAVDSCARGMNFLNMLGQRSYDHLESASGIRKTIFVEAGATGMRPSRSPVIQERDYDDLISRRYDMLVIAGPSLTKDAIRSHLGAFAPNTNCFIYADGTSGEGLEELLRGWNVRTGGGWIGATKDASGLWGKGDFANHRKTYERFRIVAGALERSGVTYRLAGHDCLTCHLFGARSLFTGGMEICVHRDQKARLVRVFREGGAGSLAMPSVGRITIEEPLPLSVHLYTTKEQNGGHVFEFLDRHGVTFCVRSAGPTPVRRRFGPVHAYTFQNPVPYLTKEFGPNFMDGVKLPLLGEAPRDPRLLYSDCYDYYSHDRSDKWREELIQAGIEVIRLMENNGIKCWLDGGSLLGAVRNNDICPGDDDVDVGIFVTDLDKLYDIALPSGFELSGSQQSGCVIRKKKHDILYDVEILAYFRNDDHRYQCNRYRDTSSLSDRARKCAIPLMFFDTLSTVVLGDHSFPCPSDPTKYVELPGRYGSGCVNGDPQPHAKSGNQNWIGGFSSRPPPIRY